MRLNFWEANELVILIKSYFGTVKPGELYEFRAENPFSPSHTVKVLAVKNGWVKYVHLAHDYWPAYEDSMKVGSFLYYYSKLSS